MNHTPGPWRAEINVADEIWIHGDHVSFIAQVSGPHARRQINENARLIAAAPDMLSELIEFCRGNCDICTMRPCLETCGLKQAKEIIERAAGRKIKEVI